MDNETKYFIQDEVHRQLAETINEMSKSLARKAKRRTPWWKRALHWVSFRIHMLILDYKRQQWARLTPAERVKREDAWLSSTLPKLRGRRPAPTRRVERGDEDREFVLETGFVKTILEQPKEAN